MGQVVAVSVLVDIDVLSTSGDPEVYQWCSSYNCWGAVMEFIQCQVYVRMSPALIEEALWCLGYVDGNSPLHRYWYVWCWWAARLIVLASQELGCGLLSSQTRITTATLILRIGNMAAKQCYATLQHHQVA